MLKLNVNVWVEIETVRMRRGNWGGRVKEYDCNSDDVEDNVIKIYSHRRLNFSRLNSTRKNLIQVINVVF